MSNNGNHKEVFSLIILPLLIAIFLLLYLFFVNDLKVWPSRFVAFIASVSSVGSLMAYYNKQIPHKVFGPCAVLNFLAVLLIYALIYCRFGLVYGGVTEYADISHTFRDALYFSTVSFTTLGYGDFQPPIELRLVAAGQALTGYIFLGFIISIVSNWGGIKLSS